MTALALLLLTAAPTIDRGLAMFRDQQFDLAAKEFRGVLAITPKRSLVRIYLARTLVEMNRVPEAVSEIERALSDQPSPEARFQAGRLLRELAESRFKQLQLQAGDSPAVLELSGERFERTGDLAKALQEYRAAAALDGKRPGVHYRIGNILWRMRELEPAQAELKKELEMSPHHGMANLRMGQTLLAADNAAASLPYLERAVTAMPQSIEARREIGKAFRKAERLGEARQAWEIVAKARPEDDQIHYLLGNLYRDLGESSLASRELETHRQILERRRARGAHP
ncbi:MAG TPA: tetratricopeptide repeat protein [Bryobacteraceae bacterium]|nr:tetratricopeptide repeat protein [Bryobacteraceae bacterium]